MNIAKNRNCVTERLNVCVCVSIHVQVHVGVAMGCPIILLDVVSTGLEPTKWPRVSRVSHRFFVLGLQMCNTKPGIILIYILEIKQNTSFLE